jgi:hypothetical protein
MSSYSFTCQVMHVNTAVFKVRLYFTHCSIVNNLPSFSTPV